MPLTFQCLKDELVGQPFLLLRREFYVRQPGRPALDAQLARVPSSGATFRLGARLAGVRPRHAAAAAAERLERVVRVLHDVEEERRVAEDLVVVEARLVLEEAEYLLPVLVGLVLAGQTEPELAVAVRAAVVGDAVEERLALAPLILLRHQLVVAGLAHHEHRRRTIYTVRI